MAGGEVWVHPAEDIMGPGAEDSAADGAADTKGTGTTNGRVHATP